MSAANLTSFVGAGVSINALVGAITINPTPPNGLSYNLTGHTITLDTPQDVRTSAAPTFIGLNATGTSPFIVVNNTSGATDEKLWVPASTSSNKLVSFILNDANTVGVPYMTVSRSGNSVTSIEFDSPTMGINTAPQSGKVAKFHGTTDQNLTVSQAITVSGAIALEAVNDAYTTNIPLEIRASSVIVPFGEVGSILSTTPSQFRAINTTYSALIRNDDTDTLILLTNSGSPYGNFNSLRPFTVHNSNATVTVGGGSLTVIHGGNVGIGTATPADLLDVAGTVRSQRFSAVGSGQLELQLINLGSSADQKYTELIEYGGVFQGRFINDAYSAAEVWMNVHRNAGTYTVGAVNFPNGNFAIGTDSPTSGAKAHIHANTDQNFTVRGAISISGAVALEAVDDAYTTNVPLEIRASATYLPLGDLSITNNLNVGGTISTGSHFITGTGQLELQLKNTGNPTDQKYVELINDGGGFHGRTVNDAYSAAQDFMVVARNSGSYTIGSVAFPNGSFVVGNDAGNTLQYVDIYNSDTGSSAGVIQRLVTQNAANTGLTTVNLVKFRTGAFNIDNGEPSGNASINFNLYTGPKLSILTGGYVEMYNPGNTTYGTTLRLIEISGGNQDGPKLSWYKTMTSSKAWSAGIINGANAGSWVLSEDGDTSGFGSPRITVAPGGAVSMSVQLYSTLRTLNAKLNESVSVLDFGCVGDGTTNDTTAFQNAMNTVAAAGGWLRIPGGYNLSIANVSIPSGLHLIGDGPAVSKITSRGGLTTGVGLLDLNAVSNITIDGIYIDGAVTTPVGITYASAGDPGDAQWTDGTSIRIHSGSSDIRIEDVVINHTGGYSVYGFGNISRVKILHCSITNSRPHLLGVTGDLTYGSWGGGILFENDGTSNYCSDIKVDHCSFYRCTGTAFWTHIQSLSGTPVLNRNIAFTNNYGEDLGLDMSQATGIDGYVETGNFARRVGYVVTDDAGSTRAPKWINTGGINVTPVVYDTAGMLLNATRTGNAADCFNGEMFDLDGCGQSTLDSNVGTSSFSSTDPLADTTHCGPASNGVNWCRGINVSNSNNLASVGQYLVLSNNKFFGCGGGSLSLYAMRHSKVLGNLMYQPDVSQQTPIVLGNIGTGTNQRSYDNDVTNNAIHWNPSSLLPGVVEDAAGGAFSSSDINRVSTNSAIGNIYEFLKNNNSSSTTGATHLSSVTAQASGVVEAITQVEGQGTTSADFSLKFYQNTPSHVPTNTVLASMTSTTIYVPALALINGAAGIVDSSRNFLGNSVSLGSTPTIAASTAGLFVDNARNITANSILIGTNGSSPVSFINSTRDANANSYAINGSGIVDNARNFSGHALTIGSTVVFDSATNCAANSYSIGGTLIVSSSRNMSNIGTVACGQITTSAALVSLSGINAGTAGISCGAINPNGNSGATLDIGVFISAGVAYFYNIAVGTGSLFNKIQVNGGAIIGLA